MAKANEELREVRKQWFSELELKQQESCSKERLKVRGGSWGCMEKQWERMT